LFSVIGGCFCDGFLVFKVFFFLRSGDHGERMSDTKRICDDTDCGQEKKNNLGVNKFYFKRKVQLRCFSVFSLSK
jgi:hypothetical protein